MNFLVAGGKNYRFSGYFPMDHLDQLEAQSVYILREAYHSFSNLCMRGAWARIPTS